MARIKVFKNTTFIQELELDPIQTYLAGRGETCQIKLDPEAGISRQHFQIAKIDSDWRLEVLSRYGELYSNNEKVSTLILTEGKKFSVPPYDFQFGEGSIQSSQHTDAEAGDRTVIAVLPSAAYLQLIDHKAQVKQIFRLEGEAWIAGRDVTCSLYIDNPKISRRQFEMYREGSNYFIRDLGSSNGTQVNGHSLSTEDWTHLQSGDVITIVDWTLQFEIRDTQFQQKISQVDTAFKQPMVTDQFSAFSAESEPEPTQYGPIPTDSSQAFGTADSQWAGAQLQGIYLSPPPPPVTSTDSGLKAKWIHFKSKMNPVRWAILGIIIFGLIYGIYDNISSGGKSDVPTTSKQKSGFDSLKPEDQQMVQQAYNAAEQLMLQNRFQLALQEINRIKEKIPFYKDSREIESAAIQGIEMENAARKEQQVAKEKEETEEKIKNQVQRCRSEMDKETVEMIAIDSCLAPVLPLNPEHALIQSFKNEVDQIINERKIRLAKQEQNAIDSKKLKDMYAKAMALEEKEKFREALKDYDFILSSFYPDPTGIKKKAAKRREDLINKMSIQQVELEKKADQLQKEGKFKEAVIALQKSLAINPDNESIKGRLAVALLELKKQMQNLFQESIIEESVGDVDAAKGKWKKIMDQSLPSEEYYDKARLKLKKYGTL